MKGDVDRNAFYGTENQWRMFVQSKCDPRDDSRLKGLGICRDMDAVQTASIRRIGPQLDPRLGSPQNVREPFFVCFDRLQVAGRAGSLLLMPGP